MEFYQQSIQSLFEDALIYDEPYTAHLIYLLAKKGKVNLQDPISKLFEMEVTVEEQAEISRMKAADILAMRKIKLYAIKRSPTIYVFYFANNPVEAQKLHHELYGEWVNHIINAYNQMIDRGLYFPDTSEVKTFRELMRETVVFPRLVCEMEG